VVENLQLALGLLAMVAFVAGFLWTENKVDEKITEYIRKGK